MFDELQRLAQKLDGMKVSVSPSCPPDEEGYLDRECPAPDCLFLFKVFAEDWRNIVRDEEVFCPFCGHSDDAKKWFTTEQVANMKRQALAHVKGMLGEAMHRDAEAFNRKQPSSGFITMSMKVSHRPQEIVLPVSATDPMRLKITCETCGCRYAVIGSAFFCPSCGRNAADHVFRQSLGTIKATLDVLPTIRANLPDSDTAENTARTLIEVGLQNAVMAFQRYAEAMFSKQPNPPKVRRNVFQNLADGSAVWRQAFGKDYSAYLQAAELATLGRYFQQRHLLAHREGLVDADYVQKSGDNSYRAGQRIVIREDAVRECVDLVQKLCEGMASDAP